jgi:RHS repeat-associated protein
VQGGRVDEIVAQITPGNGWQRYFQYDARGHCTLQTDASGDVVEQYDYDAFGFPYFYDRWGNNMPSSPWGNRFLFTGREWLGDLRTYDYRNRMYQPELGRFLQPDPKQFAAGDYNLYRYCHNDPVNKSDPLGLDVEMGTDIYSVWSHQLIGVTDAAAGRMHYFEFYTKGSNFGSRGRWDDAMAVSSGYRPDWRHTTTPEQDLALLNGFRDAQKHPHYYSIFGHRECRSRPLKVLENALGSRGPAYKFDPVNHTTGDIHDAKGNSVGWENPDTGNIYDKRWNWAGWNPDWKKTFAK